MPCRMFIWSTLEKCRLYIYIHMYIHPYIYLVDYDLEYSIEYDIDYICPIEEDVFIW